MPGPKRELLIIFLKKQALLHFYGYEKYLIHETLQEIMKSASIMAPNGKKPQLYWKKHFFVIKMDAFAAYLKINGNILEQNLISATTKTMSELP